MKKQKEKKFKKWQVFLLTFLAIIFLVLIAGVMVFKHYYNMMDIQHIEETKVEQMLPEEEIKEDTKEDAEEEPNLFEGMEGSERTFNIMLVGVDSRQDNLSGRTDSMILVHINPDTKKAVLTSFLRDIYIKIPEHGSNRLNAAYVFGGTELLKDTISSNFDINIDNFVVLNFWSVIDVLDAFGGVDIDITEEEIKYINYYVKEHNRILENPEGTDYLTASDAGMKHLNGNQALAYARIRYIGTDFARTSRQREVIGICIEKLKKMSIMEINEMLETYLPRIKTDLTEKELTTLLFMALEIKDYEVESMAIPVDNTWSYASINGMSVIQIDVEANKNAWHDKVVGQ